MTSFVLAPLAQYPLLWLVALVNALSLFSAVLGSLALSLRRRQWAWLPIGVAVFVSYALTWAAWIRAGRIPLLPYARITRAAGAQGLPLVSVNYNFDLVAAGIALGVILALRRNP
jgi:hypothetical protein